MFDHRPLPPIRRSLTACAIACGLATVAVAGPPVSVPSFREPVVGSAPENFEAPGVLVLVGGRLVEGHVSESASGYLVNLPRGRYVVPFERVLLAARDKRDAYEKQLLNMRRPTPVLHFELAQWCLRYGMNDEAKTELRSALALAGNYSPARELLEDIEQLERPAAPRHQQVDPAESKTDDGYEVPDSVSVAGLSPETASLFTAKIQPLLVNSCGNASCHGGDDPHDFALQRVRFGQAGIRTKTQQNLAAALKYVDPSRPRSSPLLSQPTGIHGGGRRPVFDGRGGRRQLELLEKWVLLAAVDLGGVAPASEPAPNVARRWDPRPRTPLGVNSPTASVSNVQRVSATQYSPPDDEPDLLDRILEEERPDAFDPAAFNRMTGTKSTPSSAGSSESRPVSATR